jgi:hypothetical protein
VTIASRARNIANSEARSRNGKASPLGFNDADVLMKNPRARRDSLGIAADRAALQEQGTLTVPDG